MALTTFGKTFVTLLVVMDPFGTAPVFLSLTRNQPRRLAQRNAIVASLAAMAVVLVFALFGQVVLSYLHVSLASLSTAGGLLLILVALEMLQGQGTPPGEAEGIALVPLATPLLADQLAKWIPPAALHFLTRIFGFLLAAIAVQLVVDGATALAR